MKKAKILYGSDEIAKGALATQLADGYKDAVIVDLECPDPFDETQGWTDWTITPETDLIIFRNVPSSFDYEKYFPLINDGFKVNKKHQPLFQINPDFIFITRYRPNGSDAFDHYFDLIELHEPVTEKASAKREKIIDWRPGAIRIKLAPWRKHFSNYLWINYGQWELAFRILPF